MKVLIFLVSLITGYIWGVKYPVEDPKIKRIDTQVIKICRGY